MAEPIPFVTLQKVAEVLSVISIDAGYNTDIGLKLRIDDAQRSDSDMPSIAIGSTSGVLDLTSESPANGTGQKSPRARRMALTLEAAMEATLAQEHQVAHLMLEDIERALSIDSRLLPPEVRGAKFTTWTMLPRQPGDGFVVLQILGSADYQRPQPNPA